MYGLRAELQQNQDGTAKENGQTPSLDGEQSQSGVSDRPDRRVRDGRHERAGERARRDRQGADGRRDRGRGGLDAICGEGTRNCPDGYGSPLTGEEQA